MIFLRTYHQPFTQTTTSTTSKQSFGVHNLNIRPSLKSINKLVGTRELSVHLKNIWKQKLSLFSMVYDENHYRFLFLTDWFEEKTVKHLLTWCCNRTLSTVLPATGTPVLATFTSGLAAAVAALVIRLEVLVEMMSIGKSIRCVKTVFVVGFGIRFGARACYYCALCIYG